jgi:hypothetical protein
VGVEKPEDLANQYYWAAEVLDCCTCEAGDVNLGFLKIRYLYGETQLQTAFPALAKAYKRQLAKCIFGNGEVGTLQIQILASGI